MGEKGLPRVGGDILWRQWNTSTDAAATTEWYSSLLYLLQCVSTEGYSSLLYLLQCVSTEGYSSLLYLLQCVSQQLTWCVPGPWGEQQIPLKGNVCTVPQGDLNLCQINIIYQVLHNKVTAPTVTEIKCPSVPI